MRGLMIKDIRLLFQRKQSFLILLFVMLFMGFSMDGSFVIAYMTFFSVVFSSSAISYDEHDNGYLFLMSLPIDAKTYVIGKYLFSLMAVVVAWAAGVLLTFISAAVRQVPWSVDEGLAGAMIYLPVAMILIAACLFLYIKFGAAKGGMALAVAAGVFFAFITVITKSGLSVSKFVEKIGQQPVWVLLAGSFAVGIALFLVSMLASIRVMEKKEF